MPPIPRSENFEESPDFNLLAMKVLGGEATLDEQKQMSEILQRDETAKKQFAELKEAHQILQEVAPLEQAIDAQAPPLPEHRLGQLRSAVRCETKKDSVAYRETFSLKTWWQKSFCSPAFAVAGATLVLTMGILLWQSTKEQKPSLLPLVERGKRSIKNHSQQPSVLAGFLLPETGQPEVYRAGQQIPLRKTTPLMVGDQIKLANGSTIICITTPAGSKKITGPKKFIVEQENIEPAKQDSLAIAILQPMSRVLANISLEPLRSATHFPIYSPQGYTRGFPLVVVWKAEAGKKYDLQIRYTLGTAQPALKLEGVVPPIDFSLVPEWKDKEFVPDGLYKISISESENPSQASEGYFQAAKDLMRVGREEKSPSEKIERARQSLSEKSPRWGDALAELLTLPEEYAQSELVLRFKLYIFGKLGLEEEFGLIKKQLQDAEKKE